VDGGRRPAHGAIPLVRVGGRGRRASLRDGGSWVRADTGEGSSARRSRRTRSGLCRRGRPRGHGFGGRPERAPVPESPVRRERPSHIALGAGYSSPSRARARCRTTSGSRRGSTLRDPPRHDDRRPRGGRSASGRTGRRADHRQGEWVLPVLTACRADRARRHGSCGAEGDAFRSARRRRIQAAGFAPAESAWRASRADRGARPHRQMRRRRRRLQIAAADGFWQDSARAESCLARRSRAECSRACAWGRARASSASPRAPG
jgi:hypothetical protein